MSARVDRWFTLLTRQVARRTSRRSFLTRLATVLLGAAAYPLLPVARASTARRDAISGEPDASTPAGDPGSCDYWRHCAIDGFLCSCCGGTQRSCPPGTIQSPVTWIGTCRNPADGKQYIISYNDCCGKHACGLCFCHRNEGDKPIYYPQRSNDINWCFGIDSVVYHCSTAIALGALTEE
jgi:methylamine dehydrogenase light chain